MQQYAQHKSIHQISFSSQTESSKWKNLYKYKLVAHSEQLVINGKNFRQKHQFLISCHYLSFISNFLKVNTKFCNSLFNIVAQ